MSDTLSIVMVGEVDHGKSSIVGRIVDETGAISPSRIETVKRICAEQGKEFEHAFLLDAFEEEQRQGITIDVSRIQFSTPSRTYTLIDAPGHREFLKNMISGSSSADAAILLVDAQEGVREQSRRHCYLLKFIGIENIVVAINKMDLKSYDRFGFDLIRKELENSLSGLGLKAKHYVPLSAKFGINITHRKHEMPWYQGPTLIEALDLLSTLKSNTQGPLRFAVQDTYKFDERRIIAGRIESGSLQKGSELTVWPSQKKVTIASIEKWSSPTQSQANAGESIGITLFEQAFVERGNVLSHTQETIPTSTLLDASIFWMGKTPLLLNTTIRIKLLTQEMDCQVTSIHRIINTTSLEGNASTTHQVDRYEVAEITLKISRPLVLDDFKNVPESGRFVLVESGQVTGGGIVTHSNSLHYEVESPTSKEIAFEFSHISPTERSAKNGHQAAIIWLTGLSGSGKSTLAKALEKELFRRGCQTSVLDGDNIRHGLNSDLDFSPQSRSENIRRVGEVAKLFERAGNIVITAFISPFSLDRTRVKNIAKSQSFFEIYLKCSLETCEKRDSKGLYRKVRAGEVQGFTGVSSPYEEPTESDLVIDTEHSPVEDCTQKLIEFLENKNIFKST